MIHSANEKGSYGIIKKYQHLLRLKNRQLEGLKSIAVRLAQTEDETSFIVTILPIIQKAINLEGNISLFVRSGNKTLNISDFSDSVMENIWGCLITDHDFGEDPVVVDFDALGNTLSRIFIPKELPHNAFCPIFHNDKRLGFFAFSQQMKRPHSEDETIFLRYIGEAMGVFFNTSKLRNDVVLAKQNLERNFNELFAVYSVSKVISSYLDTKAILENTLDALFSQKILNLEPTGCVFLVNQTNGRLEMAKHKGLPKILADAEKSIPLGHCLCGLAAQSGETIICRNCFTDTRHHTRYKGMTPHGHIIIPLKNQGKVTGVLCLYMKADDKATVNQINMLTTIANHLGTALENARLYEEIKHLSMHDSLTGLANRNLLQARLEEEIIRARRYNLPLSLAMVDIDNFKDLNDEYGHMAGDQILKDIAKIFRKMLRRCDLVARFGGEEFTILLPHTNIEQALIPLERIRTLIHTSRFSIPNVTDPIQITVSMGVCANSPDMTGSGIYLLETADKALYKAKTDGRNRIIPCDTLLQ